MEQAGGDEIPKAEQRIRAAGTPCPYPALVDLRLNGWKVAHQMADDH